MAELVVYDYVGPGEQLTAETLAKALPADWLIIAGRALPTAQKDDVDLLVVGKNRIFVLEQKHWGPQVVVKNGGWWVKGALRPSPIGRNTQVAKILAGVLKAAVAGYALATKGTHLVEARVVLSYPDLVLDTSAYPYDDSQILLLDEVATNLKTADAGSTELHHVRKALVEFLGGLSVRTARPTILGPFEIDTEVEGVGRSRVFQGKDGDGDPVVLRAYPMDGWGIDVDPRQLVKHERQATKHIADIQRSWSVEATFEDDARRWIILPIRPVASVSLARHAAAKHLQVRDSAGVTDRAANIVLDAFEALAEVHAKGVVHRGLMPDRILVGKGDRVLLRDFYLAHADSQMTVGPIVADTVDGSVPFRAPEAEFVIGAASTKSDVYALALSLLWWINGDVAVKDSEIRAMAGSIGHLDAITETLLACLTEKADERPDAATVADQLRGLLHPPPPADPPAPAAINDQAGDLFAVGGTVDNGRYVIEHALGHGGFATSWRALDTKLGASRVIKQYVNSGATWQVKQEFDAAQKLNHVRCARVWDCSPEPPVYLVADFIEGQSLRDFGQEGTASDEDYRLIALDALEGLAYMHAEGSLHRDISPTNIIVKDDGRAVLIDFGLAIAKSDAVTVVGTPAFMAPEVHQSGTWSASADLYALGASLLQVMLNRSPFTGGDKATPERLSPEEEETWGPNGTAILKALFKLVEPNSRDRPPSAQTFATYLMTVAAPQVEAGERKVNPTVLNLRRLYRGSDVGNAGNRGLDDDFARQTYVETRLDTLLTPSVLAGELDVVLLTGNPGDGKTSFLSTLRERLLGAGATDVTTLTPAGWRMKLGSRTFAAVYDASEARDGKSSDEILEAALDGHGAKHTALIAINDGRLVNFFSQYSDVYPECYVAVDRHSRDLPTDNPRIAIVDLKRRSVAPTESTDGLAGAVLDSFVDNELWTDCASCTARAVCPILGNRNLLRGPGKNPLLELVSISHLRRKRRATFRDIRSAMAWTITGDRGCEDVHEAISDGRDLRMAEDAVAFDLAFQTQNPDYLVAEWGSVDPSMLAAPGVQRALRDGTFGLEPAHRPGSENRQLFFDGDSTSPVGRADVRAYRYFDEFVEALAGRIQINHVRQGVLLGLSRVLGAPGYQGDALALRDGESAGWSVLREISAEQFTLAPLPVNAKYVEQQPDGLRLSHKLGSLVLTLDSYELVRRAADGELLGDAGSDAVKLELSAFGNMLRTTPAEKVLVVDPAGHGDSVRNAAGVLTRETANR